MNTLLLKIYLRQPPYGVLLLKTDRHSARFNHIENPEELKLKLKTLAAGMEGQVNPKGCFVLKGKEEVAGVLLYKVIAGIVTLRLMGSDFCWRGTLTEFKRAIRSL